MPNNRNLKIAQKAKKDEFYTQYSDIAKELPYYKEQLANKIIYCSCDNPKYSNFYKFFKDNFVEYGIKSLIATYFNPDSYTYKTTFDGENEIVEPLGGHGDFRSPICVDILQQADIVITNPPFSKFREFLAWILEANKKFLIIGHINCITYKEVFPRIKANEIWLGNGMGRWISGFIVPPDYELYGTEAKINEEGQRIVATNSCLWLTNIDHGRRHQPLSLMTMGDNIRYSKHKEVREQGYPKYDNYDAIEVPFTDAIPGDYDDIMGVPVTFLDKYNPEQFEIIGLGTSRDNFEPNKTYINPYKVRKNGEIVNGGSVNSVLTLSTKTKPVDMVYYTSDNSDYLIPPYARILIRKRANINSKPPYEQTNSLNK